MPRNFSLFAQTKLNSEQLAYAQELVELQSQVQQLFNTLRNVYGDICHTATATNKVVPRSLFGTAGILEAVDHQSKFTAPLLR